MGYPAADPAHHSQEDQALYLYSLSNSLLNL